MHYGSDFVPFLENLTNVVDSDSAWARKADHLLDDADDPYSISDGEDESLVVTTDSASSNLSSVTPSHANSIGSNSRERKQSLPLSAKALIMPITSSHPSDATEISPKQLLKELNRQSLELQNYDCSEIAEEITRVEAKLFMEIEVCQSICEVCFIPLTCWCCSRDIGSGIRSLLVAKIPNLTLSHGLTLFQTILRIGNCRIYVLSTSNISVGLSL